MATEAHVLPWQECPQAVGSSDRIPGMTLEEIRARVRAELTGVGTCTHLNDVFRSLADLGAMATHLASDRDAADRATSNN